MKIESDKCAVFFDFDNTIAACDTFDGLLPRFAQDDSWIELEERWKRGEIGSKECLLGQLKCMRLTKDRLDKYLTSIKLDPYFKKLLNLFDSKKIRPVILSDNFDYLLNRIFNSNNIKGLKVYSNKLRFSKNYPIPRFPFTNRNCKICAHCKKKNLLANIKKNSIIIYIGDGYSDICPAQCADIIFAKESLLKHCQNKNLACFEFKNLKDIYDYFKEILV
jgi:2,3-diketo-5-methylthio-1-phosphopentane phosphatase